MSEEGGWTPEFTLTFGAFIFTCGAVLCLEVALLGLWGADVGTIVYALVAVYLLWVNGTWQRIIEDIIPGVSFNA